MPDWRQLIRDALQMAGGERRKIETSVDMLVEPISPAAWHGNLYQRVRQSLFKGVGKALRQVEDRYLRSMVSPLFNKAVVDVFLTWLDDRLLEHYERYMREMEVS